MDWLFEFGRAVAGSFVDTNERVSAVYILCAVGLAFVLWLRRGRGKSFVQWLLPREIYTHRSNLLDIKLFLTNKLLGFVGVTGAVFFPATVAYAVLTLMGRAAPDGRAAPGWGIALAVTVIVVLVSDFCKYWAHRWHHEVRALWPFHAVHHSADVLTPLTVQRAHPVESMIRNLLISCLLGLAQGLIIYVLVGWVDVVTLAGANALYFLFNALGANLRHSHIWLSYGRVAEHILISPAQHQIHHSVAKEHHDKNYGSMFAIWDWMFGTLYVPERQEELRFGVADADGNPLPQPYETLGAALLGPFAESWQALWPGRKADRKESSTG